MYFPYLVPVLFYDVTNYTYTFTPSLMTFNREVYVYSYISSIKYFTFNSTARNLTIFNRMDYTNIYNPSNKTILFNVSVRVGDPV